MKLKRRMDVLRFRHYIGEIPYFSREDPEVINGLRLVLVNPVEIRYDIESECSYTVSGEFVLDINLMTRL